MLRYTYIARLVLQYEKIGDDRSIVNNYCVLLLRLLVVDVMVQC